MGDEHTEREDQSRRRSIDADDAIDPAPQWTHRECDRLRGDGRDDQKNENAPAGAETSVSSDKRGTNGQPKVSTSANSIPCERLS
jgi:hypothetical protein